MRLPLFCLLLLPIAGGASPAVAAQEREAGIRPYLEVGTGLTTVHGDVVTMGEGGAGLRVTPWLEISGGGSILFRPVELGEVSLQELEMRVGWGGIALSAGPDVRSSGLAWFLRTSLGAGNVDVDDRTLGITVDSDNFFLVEPSIGIRHVSFSHLEIRASLSYRSVHGVEDLPGVTSSDLRSLSFHIGVLAGPF